MNSRISKLLRSYAQSTGKPLRHVKREWNLTPRDKRGAVRSTIESGLWSEVLRGWREKENIIGKEAAALLGVGYDTYRSWESIRNTPSRFAQIALKNLMQKISDDRMKAFK